MTNLSNRNTSNCNTSKAITTPTDPKSFYRMVVGAFTIGDSVLCPAIGNGSYTLQPNTNPDSPNSPPLMINDGINCHELRTDGRFFDSDPLPSLFHDTPANRQAIATLYQYKSDVKVIDITESDDDEVVKVPSVLLSDIACDAVTALESFNDIATMLYMIYNGNLQTHQIESFSRLAYETAFKRADTQSDIISKLNKPLAQSKYGQVEVRS